MWLISFVIAVVAICAGMAWFGFKGRVTTIGVDLGTTFSVVGINQHGKIVIVEDKFGHKIFPSVVSYMDSGHILAAYDALPQLSLNSMNTIYNAKRFIGRNLDEVEVQNYANEHSFDVVRSNLSNFSKVGFQINATEHQPIVTPEQVGTQVLKFLLGITADFLGHKQVNKAVIAVPAKFDSNQRKATADAYKNAGLKVVRVIEEPTAAAVAYKLHKKSNIHHILVYDFGGGTLDVSLLYVARGSVQVYATDGDETLGGSDFDICLSGVIQKRIEQVTSKRISDVHTDVHTFNEGAVNDLCTLLTIRIKAEQIKKELTYSDNVAFNCHLPESAEDSITSKSSIPLGPVSFSVSKTEDFELGCGYLFERALLPVTKLLTSLEMDKEDIDEVVLVGGSTRMPLVKRQLREYFGKELNDHIDPDITVAYGAASILD